MSDQLQPHIRTATERDMLDALIAQETKRADEWERRYHELARVVSEWSEIEDGE